MGNVILPKTEFDSYMSTAGGVGHLKQLGDDEGTLPSQGVIVLHCDNTNKGNKDFRIIGVVLGSS